MSRRPDFVNGLPDRWTEIPWRERVSMLGDASRIIPLKPAVEDCKTLCRRCLIREARFDHAIENAQQDGICGGRTLDERNALVPQRTTSRP
ncbi:WhiB family transcriptional regulator [Streptomyces sp. NPDC005732]|uniref:WhiB family transcriptional regulator n=1 Tax=Streptomyces sp. NPDC005732 TaxID=3157057 RepID=UPI00340CB63C